MFHPLFTVKSGSRTCIFTQSSENRQSRFSLSLRFISYTFIYFNNPISRPAETTGAFILPIGFLIICHGFII